MARTPSARRTTRRTPRPIAAGLVAATAAIIGTLVYQSASSSATSPPRPGPAQPSVVTPRNGPLGAIAWPASGVSAAGISGIGVLPGPGASQPVPIASVAKVMTAYVILRDHPLGAGESGPPIVVRPGEAAAYPVQARNGDSLVPVAAGEQLTERQALEALLLPSADNMAWILARWDAGSQAAFTAQMNAAARRLGMTGTHYTDPSGLSASTTSTAADQVRLGMAAMREPALAQIAALRSAVIPVAGVVRNYNTLLGQDGITGLKTGSDTAAGGCILLAAWQQARGHDTLLVAATFGQPGTMATMLPTALQAGHQLVLALGRALAGQSAQHITGNKAGSAADRPPQSQGDSTRRRRVDGAPQQAGSAATSGLRQTGSPPPPGLQPAIRGAKGRPSGGPALAVRRISGAGRLGVSGVSATAGVSSAAVTGSPGGGGTAMSDEGFGAIMSVLDTPLVVVTAARAQERAGCLVGFHCQSSIEPPRYCVWLSKANHTYRVALGSTHLAIHFLTSADLWLAERFGTLTGDRTDKFAGLPVRAGPGQAPVLEQCSHWLAARRGTLLDEGGDHVCLITEPVAVHTGGPFEPLRLSQAAHLEPGHGSQERHSPPTERAARPQSPGAIT